MFESEALVLIGSLARFLYITVACLNRNNVVFVCLDESKEKKKKKVND